MKLFLPLYETFVSVIIISLYWLIHRFNLFMQYQPIILMIGFGILILAASSVYLLSRKRKLGNYCKSLNDSCRLRRFLRQQNSISDYTSKVKVNLDQRIYNSALWYTYIDYAEDSMEVWVCIPNNFNAKKVLDSNLDNIAQEVSSYTDNYICSGPTRKGSFYVYKGEKK